MYDFDLHRLFVSTLTLLHQIDHWFTAAPNPCTGPNGEAGSCISETSCADIKYAAVPLFVSVVFVPQLNVPVVCAVAS